MANETWQQDWNPELWLSSACWQMLKLEPAIRKKLKSEHHLGEFEDDIRGWNNTHLDGTPYDPKNTAAALYGICCRFDLMAMVGDPGSVVRAATTRGTGPGEPAAGLEALLREVAGTFGGLEA